MSVIRNLTLEISRFPFALRSTPYALRIPHSTFRPFNFSLMVYTKIQRIHPTCYYYIQEEEGEGSLLWLLPF